MPMKYIEMKIYMSGWGDERMISMKPQNSHWMLIEKKWCSLLFQWKGSDWSGGWKWCWKPMSPEPPSFPFVCEQNAGVLGQDGRSNSSRSISTVSWKACLQRISISHHFKTPCTCSNNDMLVIFGDVWWCRICVALWGLRSSLQGLFAPEGTSRGTMRATIFPRTPAVECWTMLNLLDGYHPQQAQPYFIH